MPKITFDSDEEFVFEEKEVEKKQDIIEKESESSDDEAPEAISISSSRSKALEKAKVQKEIAIKQAKADKEKRRQRDLQLKEQKKGSKREKKEQTKKVESESESDKEMDEDEEEEDDHDTSNNKLPQSILNEFKKSTDSEEKKRTHLTVEDFERLEAIKEAKEKENLERQRKRQKIQEKGRMVGEYTVKIINQRPKVAKAGKGLQSMKNEQLHRSSIPRRNAIMNASMSRREGGALIFRRDGHSKSKFKK